MSRISTSLFQDKGIQAILDQQRLVSETQLQISTGKRVNTPADDPIASSRLLSLKNSQVKTEKFQENIDSADTKLSFAEVALNSMNKSITKLRELAINVNNGSFTPTEKASIQQEMENILESLVDTANTQLAGEYIFSGFKTLNKPVLKLDGGKFSYAGDEGIQFTQIGPSTEVAVNTDGKSTFFVIPADDVLLSGFSGLHNVTSSAESLQAPGLNVLGANELKINDITIGAAVSDGVSTSEASASAIATANAINLLTSEHNVRATVSPNVVTLTSPTYNTGANQLTGVQFVINGQAVTGDPTDQASFIQIINNAMTAGSTGIVASANGLNIDLTASDGRNIHLQSDGSNAEVDFTNFSIDTVDQQIKRAQITLTDHNAFTIAGSTPGDVGFSAGTINNASNGGTGVMSTPKMVDVIPDGVSKDETYLIEFGTGGTTYSVYAESNPTVALTNLSNVTYTAGEAIKINGIEVTITGTPNANDTFTVTSKAETTKDLFTTVRNLIDNIGLAGGSPLELNYLIGVGINNLKAAETRLLEVRADVGARINFADTQKDSNEQFIIFAKQGISQLEDLDFVDAITKLTQQSFALEAAQSAYIKIQSLSLFNFL